MPKKSQPPTKKDGTIKDDQNRRDDEPGAKEAFALGVISFILDGCGYSFFSPQNGDSVLGIL
jgi:hypothetical protein